MNILTGFIIIFVGSLMVFKADWLLNNFGRMACFEKYLGTEGGSRLGYKLIGVIAIFIGVLIMTNMINGFLQWVLSPLLQFNQTK